MLGKVVLVFIFRIGGGGGGGGGSQTTGCLQGVRWRCGLAEGEQWKQEQQCRKQECSPSLRLCLCISDLLFA